MKNNNGKHFSAWFNQSRSNLLQLQIKSKGLPIKDRLLLIRLQYGAVVQIKKVCRGKAFFTGVPK